MKKIKNGSLKELNSFGVDVKANELIIVESESDLVKLNEEGIFRNKFLVLGNGSNILFTKDYDGVVIKINLMGKKIVETDDYIIAEGGSGEDWDQFVEYTIDNNAFGLENLSLIPGSVGASAVQNIGAYGVEVSEFIEEVEYFDINDSEFHRLKKIDLKFDYRSSIFKSELRGRAIITKVIFNLKKVPELKLDYQDIKKEIEENNLEIKTLTPAKLREIIIKIRQGKLHNPDEIGNAGSFFKNPIITKEQSDQLSQEYNDFKPNYMPDGRVKVSAGWLIEKTGWKGFSSDDKKYGVSQKHALVLLNYGGAKGEDLFNLSKDIKNSVLQKFKIELEEEVIII